MLNVVLLTVVSIVLWVIVGYAYWYSIKKTYGMRAERAKALEEGRKDGVSDD